MKSQETPDTKIWLSTLWIVILINMIYADVFSLYIPGIHKELQEFAGDTPIATLMLVAAIIIEIPILMIFFSRILRYQINRWANIIVAMAMILFVVGPEIGNEAIKPHYIFIATIEVLCLLFIIWTAFRWKSDDQN